MISKLQCGAIYKQWCSKSTSVRPVQNTGSKIQCKLMTGPGACRTLAPLGNGHGGSGSLFLPLSAGRCCPSLGCREGQHPREGSTARGWMFWCGCWAAPLLVWDGLDLFLVRGLWLRCWPILGRLEPWDPVLGSCHYPFIIFSLISSLLPPFISPLACTALDIVILYHT